MCAFLFPLQAEKALLDLGEILVGSYRSIEVPLANKSPCSVSFCLSVQQILLDEGPVYDPETVPSGTDRLSIHFTCDIEYLMHLIEPVLKIKYLLLALLALQLDCERGTIASQSTVLLRSTLRPQRGAQYLWTISYQTLNASGR